MLIAINKEIAEFPTPYPLLNNSSNKETITPAKVNCKIIKMAPPAPIYSKGPYIPE